MAITENYKTFKGKKLENRHDKELPSIKLHKNESKRDYLNRVHRITQESLQEAKFEAKYGVEVIRNKQTGEIKLKKKPKNEIDELLKQNKLNKKGSKSRIAPIALAPDEKKKLIKEMLSQKKEEKDLNKPKIDEYKRDQFKFGEVVHAPPHLATPRHAQKVETVPRVSYAQQLFDPSKCSI